MNIKVITNISKKFNDIEICIKAPEFNEEVQRLENELKNKINNLENIVGTQENSFYLININDIIKFFSEEKNNFCQTKDGIFKIKEKLYYLEEILPPKQFIRISNSTIVNIKYVKCFNAGIIGKIIIEYKNGEKDCVSRRKTSEIMKFLKERRN